jgi:hypothetical protein
LTFFFSFLSAFWRFRHAVPLFFFGVRLTAVFGLACPLRMPPPVQLLQLVTQTAICEFILLFPCRVGSTTPFVSAFSLLFPFPIGG